MIMLKRLMLGLILFLFCSFIQAAVPIENFTKPAIFNQLLLSPDGQYFAATVPKGNTTNLVVIDRKTMKVKIAYGFGFNEHIGRFFWANNERLVYTKIYQCQGKEQKIYRGEIFAANIDGSKRTQIFGYTMSSENKSASKRALEANAHIIHTLPDDPNHILIRVSMFTREFDEPDKIFKLNIYNQKRTFVTATPLGNSQLLINSDGQPIAAQGKDVKGLEHKFFFHNEKWGKLDKTHPVFRYDFKSVSANGQYIYLTRSTRGQTQAIYRYKLGNDNIEKVYQHPIVDVAAFVVDPVTEAIIITETVHDGAQYHYLDEEHPFSNIHRKLIEAFPGQAIQITANNAKDKELIVVVSSDVNPGDFYLFNKETNNVEYLTSRKPWLYPEDMNNRQLVSFTSRDGQVIYGYLTLPNKLDKPVPLIIDVHGGPYGVSDSWYFDTGSQIWSQHGFAVFQINFRGSGGYGKSFEEVAYLKRSTMIQQDIIDGTKWALQQENIADDKVCITGGSFGGYSALMAPLIEPTLYDCAIPMFGAYDLLYQMKNADYMSLQSVSVGAKEKYGDNEQHWIKESPLTYIDNLKTPLMIVTGGKDKRVPPQNAKNLKAELDKRDISYEWLYKPSEGHGFFNPKNRHELYQKSIDFFNKHLN